LLKKSESFESVYESFQKLFRPILSYLKSSTFDNKEQILLTGNFLVGKVLEWHLAFLQKKTFPEVPYISNLFQNYWGQYVAEFTDFMFLKNTSKEMINLKMAKMNLSFFLEGYCTPNS
jgi:hypothetical protein